MHPNHGSCPHACTPNNWTGNTYSWMPQFNCLTFILSVESATAGVPLGVFVVSNESASTIAAGLNLQVSYAIQCFLWSRVWNWSRIIFNGWTSITVWSTQTGVALHETTSLLIPQRWWRWIWKKMQDIDLEDRKDIMHRLHEFMHHHLLKFTMT